MTDNVTQIINWNTTQYLQTTERSHLRNGPSFFQNNSIKTLTLCWRALLCSAVKDDGTTWAHKAVNLKSHLDKWKTKTSMASTARSYILLNSCMTMTPRPLELYSLYIEHALQWVDHWAIPLSYYGKWCSAESRYIQRPPIASISMRAASLLSTQTWPIQTERAAIHCHTLLKTPSLS